MDPVEMTTACPRHDYVGVAALRGYRLTFDTRESEGRGCGVADAIPLPGEEVWGVVYQVSADCLRALDRKEGYRESRSRARNAYVRLTEVVQLDDGADGRAVPAVLYVVANPAPAAPPPSAEYLALLLRGARHWQLPPEYIEKLERIRTLER
jgi:gamma-glutamylcyclotransferase (GGCT)/AIG2-like uncharacterized protein YtfP